MDGWSAAKANSHKAWGWEKFTDAVIELLNKRKSNLVFILWGSHAQAKAKKLDKSKHKILMAAHPSGLHAPRPLVLWGLMCTRLELCVCGCGRLERTQRLLRL